MEILRRHVAAEPTTFAAYLALQRALMRCFVARGGSAEEFCARLSPVFRRRFAPVVLGEATVVELRAWSERCSPRLRQERGRAA